MKTYQFIGGPLDGQSRSVEDEIKTYTHAIFPNRLATYRYVKYREGCVKFEFSHFDIDPKLIKHSEPAWVAAQLVYDILEIGISNKCSIKIRNLTPSDVNYVEGHFIVVLEGKQGYVHKACPQSTVYCKTESGDGKTTVSVHALEMVKALENGLAVPASKSVSNVLISDKSGEVAQENIQILGDGFKYSKKEILDNIRREEESNIEALPSAAPSIPYNSLVFFREGDQWACVWGSYKNIQYSAMGFGRTKEIAERELLKIAPSPEVSDDEGLLLRCLDLISVAPGDADPSGSAYAEKMTDRQELLTDLKHRINFADEKRRQREIKNKPNIQNYPVKPAGKPVGPVEDVEGDLED